MCFFPTLSCLFLFDPFPCSFTHPLPPLCAASSCGAPPPGASVAAPVAAIPVDAPPADELPTYHEAANPIDEKPQ